MNVCQYIVKMSIASSTPVTIIPGLGPPVVSLEASCGARLGRQEQPPQQNDHPPQHRKNQPENVSFKGFQQSSNDDGASSTADSPALKFIKFIQSSIHGKDSEDAKLWEDSSETNYVLKSENPEIEETYSSPKQSADVRPAKRSASPIMDSFYENKKLRQDFTLNEVKREIQIVADSGPFGRVVLFQSYVSQESNIAIMERTAAAAQMRLSYQYDQGSKKEPNSNVACTVSLGGLHLSKATGTGTKVAKDLACKLAIERLKETSFAIMVKAPFFNGGSEVGHDLNPASRSSSTNIDTPIAHDNIGLKMLTIMGWGGGGLGKNMQGITEPVIAKGSIKREGLGRNNNEFTRKIHKILKDFMINGGSKDDLVFSTDFSKEERKAIHEISRKYRLKSRSYGTGENRQLVISTRPEPLAIVEELLASGGETQKYKLLPPKSLIDRYTM